MAPLTTRLTTQFGFEHPIAMAGMAFAGMTPELAIAVTNAGALGSLAIGKLPGFVVADMVNGIKANVGGKPYNLNAITIFTEDEHIAVAEEAQVPVMSFHWGHPKREWIDRLHAAGVSVWEQVGSVDDAKRAVDDGIDVIVAQGSEAGGHNYATLPTFAQIPVMVDAVGSRVPVLASGGIADGRGLAAALALGADGAWVGTRFVATPESSAHPEYKTRLLSKRGEDTINTRVYGPDHPDFNPMRILRNGITGEYDGHEDRVPSDITTEPVIGEFVFGPMAMPMHRFSNFVPTAQSSGDLDQMPLLAGQGVGLVNDMKPAAEIVSDMVRDAAAIVGRLASH
jgi:NAD(P)H-dependent flavin oxidoreductase YrpB (nitropropane dioxygenase family)